jgi:hypothetical protein
MRMKELAIVAEIIMATEEEAGEEEEEGVEEEAVEEEVDRMLPLSEKIWLLKTLTWLNQKK